MEEIGRIRKHLHYPIDFMYSMEADLTTIEARISELERAVKVRDAALDERDKEIAQLKARLDFLVHQSVESRT
jgi:hypothetical protein